MCAWVFFLNCNFVLLKLCFVPFAISCLLASGFHAFMHVDCMYICALNQWVSFPSAFFSTLYSLPIMMMMPQYVDFRFNLRIRGIMHSLFIAFIFFLPNIWIALRVFIFDFEEHMLHKTCRICSHVYLSLALRNNPVRPSPVYHFRFFNFSVAWLPAQFVIK